jgi:hypothetical protein
MSRNGPFMVLKVIGVLLLIGLIIGGGFMVYQAGVSQGIAQAPAVAKAIQQASQNGQTAPVPPMMYARGFGDDFGYGMGYYPHMYGFNHFGFFPFGGILGFLLFFFLIGGILKMLFFRRMAWGYGPHGHPWGGPPWMRNPQDEGDKKNESPEEKK